MIRGKTPHGESAMKHKDGLDIAAVLLLLVTALAVMVVPVAMTAPQLLVAPAVLLAAALLLVWMQRRRLRAFVASSFAAPTLKTAASSTA